MVAITHMKFESLSQILKSLSLYYYTFVDLLDYRDHVSELLTTLDACQITLDVTNNFDATRLYLNVVSIYVRLMILLSRVDDRKAVLGLFNAAHEMIHGQCDPSFPRLGQVKIRALSTGTGPTSIRQHSFVARAK